LENEATRLRGAGACDSGDPQKRKTKPARLPDSVEFCRSGGLENEATRLQGAEACNPTIRKNEKTKPARLPDSVEFCRVQFRRPRKRKNEPSTVAG
jgi:hypothetical protein